MKQMKHTKRFMAVLLAVLLTVTALPISTFAEDGNTPKEEVVYINLNADGSVKEINVVNIFELDEDGQIIDYGKYESLRNMTTTDKINYADETVTIDAKAGKLYYEGKLESKAMPWNIEIHYYLDGEEYSAEELAGESGNLKIAMKITENTECAGNFFEGLALQASFTLDTKKCSNIQADGATVANVGSDKQLTYTILPNKGADVEITAEVTDFEMDGIAINGVKLNLDMEIEDTEIQEKIQDITEAVNELDSGAAELADGLEAVTSQNDELINGAYATFEGLCTASETLLNAELAQNGLPTVTLTPETYDAVLTELLKLMEAYQVPAASSLTALKTQLGDYSRFYEGLKSYTAAVGSAASGATELKNGTGEFVKETSGMDNMVSEKVNEMLTTATGSDVEITSFVSEKNKNVDSVQFVIQTEGIEKEEPVEVETVAEENLNFWQKLLKLFGLSY